MDRRIHFIWGNPSRSENRIHLLKMNGMKQIVVLDKNRRDMIKEHDDIIYLPLNLVPFAKIDQPDKVHHFFMIIPPGKYGSKVKRD